VPADELYALRRQGRLCAAQRAGRGLRDSGQGGELEGFVEESRELARRFIDFLALGEISFETGPRIFWRWTPAGVVLARETAYWKGLASAVGQNLLERREPLRGVSGTSSPELAMRARAASSMSVTNVATSGMKRGTRANAVFRAETPIQTSNFASRGSAGGCRSSARAATSLRKSSRSVTSRRVLK
jgi:hypothetical protein